MSKFKSQGFGNTFKNARNGINLVLKSEVNIRVHFFAAFMVLILGLMLGMDYIKICIILIAIAIVIIAEMFNSAIEYSLDAVFHNKYSRLVGMAKDISAGAVLFATVVAVTVGILIFVPALVCVFCNIM